MNKILLRLSAIICGLSGLIIVFGVISPIAMYENTSRQKYPDLLSPVIIKGAGVINKKYDSTRASTWFYQGDKKVDFGTSEVSFYTITIPKLKIENATVAIGGEDLSQSLIQYPGTAVPGKTGNSVIFGHSILPIYFDPTNYIAIFSTISRLKGGDEVKVNYDGVSYLYRVEATFEVLPTDIQILEQNSDDSYLTLVTCSPPGHPLKPRRLIVRAKIVPPDLAGVVPSQYGNSGN